MSSLKDIMDVDVEPLDQAYRRSKEASILQASPPSITPTAATQLPPIVDHTSDDNPVKRRRSNRTLRPALQPAIQLQAAERRRSIGNAEDMDFTSGFQGGAQNQGSSSGSPSRPFRPSEPSDGVPVKFTPITGRVSKAKKGLPVHTCEACQKTFTRAEHLKRHQLSHKKPTYSCTFEGCERSFHRPDLLARHMHRHEAQGEGAEKLEDRRSSRASSRASESRTPPEKPMTTGSDSYMNANQQGSFTEAMNPQTSRSGNNIASSSTYGTGAGTLSDAAFLPDAGTGHKRTATEAQLSSPEHSAPSSGQGRRNLGNFGTISDQNTFTRPEQAFFEPPYAEGGAPQFTGYSTTTQLPQLSIPDEIWVPGLSHNGSSWCSSASDGTVSAQSETPQYYRRSGSITTLPDWSATAAAPQWSPYPMSTTPQDLSSPVFEPMLEQFDTSYVSPRIVSHLSRRSQHLDVPTTYGGFINYIESVGTPTLSRSGKPVAQNFSVSSSRTPNPVGLGAIKTKGLVESYPLAAPSFSASILPQFQSYVTSYWQSFHQSFPILHQSTFDPSASQVLNHAIIAIGTQYHNSREARTTGDTMNAACRKAIDCSPNWDLPTKQATLLTEIFNRFRGKKICVRLSRNFEELYSRLLSEPTSQLPQNQPTSSAGILIEPFPKHSSSHSNSEPDTMSQWRQFLYTEARQRLLSGCFMFDILQSCYHQQPRSKALRDNFTPQLYLPCSDDLWNASNASEWEAQVEDYVPQLLYSVESGLSPQYVDALPNFTRVLLMTWFVAQLPQREDQEALKEAVPSTGDISIEQFTSLFQNWSLAHTFASVHLTPLHSLLAVAGDTWVFAKKMSSPSAFQAAQTGLRTWSNTIAAARATHHACRVLVAVLAQPTPLMGSNVAAVTNFHLSNYWAFYICTLICWAFGHRHRNAHSKSKPATASSLTTSSLSKHTIATAPPPSVPSPAVSISYSSSSTSTPIDENSHAEEIRLQAMTYLNTMLTFSVEDLLTRKAFVKGNTQALVEAVKWRLDMDNVGGLSSLLVDAVVVLGKVGKDRERASWF